MSKAQEISNAQADAALHVLAEIQALSPTNRNESQRLLNLAEAFAWLRNPAQPHGGSVAQSTSS